MQCADNRMQDKGSGGMNEGREKQDLGYFCELKLTLKACKLSNWNLLHFYLKNKITWLLRIIGYAKISWCTIKRNIHYLKKVIHCTRLYKGIIIPLMTFSSNAKDLSSYFMPPDSAIRNFFFSSTVYVCQNSAGKVIKINWKEAVTWGLSRRSFWNCSTTWSSIGLTCYNIFSTGVEPKDSLDCGGTFFSAPVPLLQ